MRTVGSIRGEDGVAIRSGGVKWRRKEATTGLTAVTTSAIQIFRGDAGVISASVFTRTAATFRFNRATGNAQLHPGVFWLPAFSSRGHLEFAVNRPRRATFRRSGAGNARARRFH